MVSLRPRAIVTGVQDEDCKTSLGRVGEGRASCDPNKGKGGGGGGRLWYSGTEGTNDWSLRSDALKTALGLLQSVVASSFFVKKIFSFVSSFTWQKKTKKNNKTRTHTQNNQARLFRIEGQFGLFHSRPLCQYLPLFSVHFYPLTSSHVTLEFFFFKSKYI